MNEYLSHCWLDHTSYIKADCLFFFIRPKLIKKDFLQQRIESIIKKLPQDINFCLCPVDLDGYDYPSNITVLPSITYGEYEEWVQKKFFKKPRKIMGVTGTSGKTSTCNLLKNIYNINNIKSSAIGSGKCSIDMDNFSSDIPISYLGFHEFLHKSTENGIEMAILECSSYSISQERIKFITFDAVIFTSFSEDHLDYHKNFLDYFLSKLFLINYLKPEGIVIINHSIKLMDSFLNLINKPVYLVENLWDFNNFYDEDYHINFAHNIKKIFVKINNNQITVKTNEITTNDWKFNIKNEDIFQMNNLIMAAIGFWLLEEKIPLVENIEVPGRFHQLKKNDLLIFVDYCHSVEKVKYFINMLKKYLSINNLNKKIVVVIGIGSRELESRFKRLIWLTDNVDHIILTLDNIFNDFNPQKYIETIISYPNVTYIEQRDRAVLYALEKYGNENYVIGCLGLGGDNNLQINNEIIKYNEYNFIKNYLDNL